MQDPASPGDTPAADTDADTEGPCAVVLGGTGCIGRHITAAFARHGYRVLVVSREPAPHPDAHAFRAMDLMTVAPRDVERMLAEAEARVVVNATDVADAIDVAKKATDGDDSEAVLVAANKGLATRLVAAIAPLPHRPRLVHIGTIHEYGPGEAGVPVDESVVPAPVNGYARAKLAGSGTVLDAARAGTIDGVVLRLVNTCGPGPHPVSFPGRLLPLLRDAAEGKDVVLGIADAMRDWVDVRDVAEAAVKAATEPVSGHVFNIGSGVAVPMREVVALCLNAAGLKESAVSEAGSPVRSLGPDWLQADIRQAGKLLGWTPRIALKTSLQDMWDAEQAGR